MLINLQFIIDNNKSIKPNDGWISHTAGEAKLTMLHAKHTPGLFNVMQDKAGCQRNEMASAVNLI